MTLGKKRPHDVSPAAITGLAAFALAIILFFFRLDLAVVPLSAYVVLCLAASLYPSRGFFLPVVSRGHSGKPLVALTFDDGPDPATTPRLLRLLDKHAVKAVFFVTGVRAAQYSDLISQILGHGHDIGNHSYHHDPFLMLRSSKTLHREIASTQALLAARFGITPLAFRPPVGVTSSKLAPVLRKLGLHCVNFTCRAYDCGNRRIRGLSRKILKKVRADDIILLHDVLPKRKAGDWDIDFWLREVDLILAGLKDRGLRVVPLDELLGEAVMNIFESGV